MNTFKNVYKCKDDILRIWHSRIYYKNMTEGLYTSNEYVAIGGEMFNVLASSAGVRGVESRSGQTKDYKIGICCFSAKHAALRRKSKD